MKRHAPLAHIMMAILYICTSNYVLADDTKQLSQSAAEVARSFMNQLGKEMMKEMKAGGPAAAINVCTELAPSIAGQISREKGWKVTRVGTRVRNPMLGIPDAWEQQVLADFQKRIDNGESIADISHEEIVKEPDGKYFRFMKAIGVKPPCLQCHGSEKEISDSVKTILREKYPHDRAIGYKPGDLRGAVSIKQPL